MTIQHFYFNRSAEKGSSSNLNLLLAKAAAPVLMPVLVPVLVLVLLLVPVWANKNKRPQGNLRGITMPKQRKMWKKEVSHR